MAADKNKVTKRSDVNRPLKFEEGDQNLQEIKNVIDDQQGFESTQETVNSNLQTQVGTAQNDIDNHKSAADPHSQYYKDGDAVDDGVVTTGSGEQTVKVALNQRVIYVDTLADLQALPTGGLVEGQRAEVSLDSDNNGAYLWDSSGGSWTRQQGGYAIPYAPSVSTKTWLQGNRVVTGKPSDGIFSDIFDAFTEAKSRDKELYFDGLWTTSQTLLVKNGMVLQGSGHLNSAIVAGTGLNADVIQSEDFSTLTGSNTWLVSNGMEYAMRLSGFRVDGNKANNTSGRGIALYAKNYIVDGVLVVDTAGDAFYSEAGSITGQQGWEDLPESEIRSLWCRNAGGKGLHYLGPHNGYLGKIIAAYCGDWGVYFDTDDSTTYDGNADLAQHIHTYANDGEKGVYIGTTIAAGSIITDGDNLEINTTASASDARRTTITRYKCLNGGRGRDALSVSSNNVHIGKAAISLLAPVGATKRAGARLSGERCVIDDLEILGNGHENDGALITGLGTKIPSLFIRDLSGSGEALRVASSNNQVNGEITNCSTGFAYATGSRNAARLNIFTNVGQSAVTGQKPAVSDDISIEAVGEVVGRTENRIESDLFALDSTGEKTVTVPHGMLYTPVKSDIQLTLQKSTNVNDVDIGYIRVDAIDSVNITVEVGVTSASATGGAQGRVAVLIKQ